MVDLVEARRNLILVIITFSAFFTAITVLGASAGIGLTRLYSTILHVYTDPGSLYSALLYSGPIIASAVGLSLAYRAFFITIGSEGQILVSGILVLWLLAYKLSGGGPSSLVIALSASILAGSLWGLVPGLLKAYLRVNEVLVSLMLNYIALSLVNLLVSGPLRWGAFTITKSIPEHYVLHPIAVISSITLLSALYSILLWRTRMGVAVEALGLAPKAAATYGYNNRRTIIGVSLLSGASSGVGGFLMVTGFQWSFRALSEPLGYGYMGVLVAWMSANNPLIAPLPGFVFATILVAAKRLQSVGLPLSSVLALEAVVAVIVSMAVYRWRSTQRG